MNVRANCSRNGTRRQKPSRRRFTVSICATATLAFNFTGKRAAPVLDVTGKNVTAAGTVKVKIAAASGIRPVTAGSKFTLTSGGKFAGVTVSLDETNKPDWAKGVSVVDGDIVLDVKSTGLMFFVY